MVEDWDERRDCSVIASSWSRTSSVNISVSSKPSRSTISVCSRSCFNRIADVLLSRQSWTESCSFLLIPTKSSTKPLISVLPLEQSAIISVSSAVYRISDPGSVLYFRNWLTSIMSWPSSPKNLTVCLRLVLICSSCLKAVRRDLKRNSDNSRESCWTRKWIIADKQFWPIILSLSSTSLIRGSIIISWVMFLN